MSDLETAPRPFKFPEVVDRDVPYSPVRGVGRCAVSGMQSTLDHYMKGKNALTDEQMDRFCGYQEGKGTWPTQSLLSLAKLCFSVTWIENNDLKLLANGRWDLYLRNELGDNEEEYQRQIKRSNLELESKRAAEYRDRGLRFENRRGTIDDIKMHLSGGGLVQLSVNGYTLVDPTSTKFSPHAVLGFAYDQNGIRVHNADYILGDMPDQHVPWDVFEASWNERSNRLTAFAPLPWAPTSIPRYKPFVDGSYLRDSIVHQRYYHRLGPQPLELEKVYDLN